MAENYVNKGNQKPQDPKIQRKAMEIPPQKTKPTSGNNPNTSKPPKKK